MEMQAMGRAGICADAAVDAHERITGPCTGFFVHSDAKARAFARTHAAENTCMNIIIEFTAHAFG